MKFGILIKEMHYSSSKDRIVLSSCLKTWFSNPKDLHLTEPRMTYPFRFNQWINLSYTEQNTKTWVAFLDKWMVGMISVKLLKVKKCANLFHIFVDKSYSEKNIFETLIKTAENFAKQNNCSEIYYFLENRDMQLISESKNLGFAQMMTKKNQIKMVKSI